MLWLFFELDHVNKTSMLQCLENQLKGVSKEKFGSRQKNIIYFKSTFSFALSQNLLS